MPAKIEIDPKEIEKLAAMHCTVTEIAAFFDCSVDTIERKFADILHKGREKGKARLRRLQWQAAERGNVVMMIWLGKQLLKQTDKMEDVTPSNISKNEAIKELSQKLLSLTQIKHEK